MRLASAAATATAAALALAPIRAARAQLFDPNSFAPLQSNFTGISNITIDTDQVTIAGIHGIVYNGYAVFTFGNINLTSSSMLSVQSAFTGISRPIVLISQGDLNMDGIISVSGAPGIASGPPTIGVAGGGVGGPEGNNGSPAGWAEGQAAGAGLRITAAEAVGAVTGAAAVRARHPAAQGAPLTATASRNFKGAPAGEAGAQRSLMVGAETAEPSP